MCSVPTLKRYVRCPHLNKGCAVSEKDDVIYVQPLKTNVPNSKLSLFYIFVVFNLPRSQICTADIIKQDMAGVIDDGQTDSEGPAVSLARCWDAGDCRQLLVNSHSK